MATKKRASPQAAEAKAAYRTRPRRRATASAAKTPERPLGEVFWLAFQQLSEDDQGAFLRRLLEDPDWFEDIYDSIAIIQARKGPTRPFEEFEEELRREGLA
jgi:hypothetical protein